MRNSLLSIRTLCLTAIVAALYAALTLLFQPISFGTVQFRISEALTLLPMLLTQSIPGLTVGCFIANLLGSASVWDIAFGTLATLLSSLWVWRLRRNVWLAALGPIICNAIIVGMVLGYTLQLPLTPTILSVGFGETVVVLGLGIPLIQMLRKGALLRQISSSTTETTSKKWFSR